MKKGKKFGMVWLGLFLGIIAFAGVALQAPAASASGPATRDFGAILAQATPAATQAAPTQNPQPQATAQPNTNTNNGNTNPNPNPVQAVTSSDNSWILWAILIVVVLAALGGGAWYYPRRRGTVVRRETEYIDDGPAL